MGDQRVAQHGFDVFVNFVRREGEANAALFTSFSFLEFTLAAATGVDLAFHNIQRAWQFCGSVSCFLDGENGIAVCNRCAEGFKDRLGLMLVNVHGCCLFSVVKAWTPPKTGWGYNNRVGACNSIIC